MNYILLGVLLILIAVLLIREKLRRNAQRNKKPPCPEKQWWIID